MYDYQLFQLVSSVYNLSILKSGRRAICLQRDLSPGILITPVNSYDELLITEGTIGLFPWHLHVLIVFRVHLFVIKRLYIYKGDLIILYP